MTDFIPEEENSLRVESGEGTPPQSIEAVTEAPQGVSGKALPVEA
jgi:hypothetical protein